MCARRWRTPPRSQKTGFIPFPQASNAVPRGCGDLDFGAVLALGVVDRPSVVIFRLSDERAEAVNRRLEVVLSEQEPVLQSGALVLVEDVRYRVRLLPISAQ